MIMPAPLNPPDQSGIRRRFAFLLVIVGLPIVALIAILAWRSYNQAYDNVVEQIELDLRIRQNGLEQLAANTHGHVAMLKAFAESQLSTHTQLPEYTGRLDWPGDSSDPSPGEGLVMSAPGTLTTGDRHELAAVSSMFPMLRAAHRSRDYLRWSYYFSDSRKFVAIYPWAPISQMLQGSSPEAALNSYFSYDIFSMATPDKNAKREPYWTPVYFDAGGSGLMVSHGSPIYDGERFAGMVGTDILLSHIGDFLGQFPPFAGDVVLVDQSGAVVAVPGNAPDDGKSPIPAKAILGDSFEIPQEGPISEQGKYLAGTAAIAGTPWKLVVRTDRSAARTAALASIQPLAAILSSMIIMLGALAWLFRNQFVAPAIALVNFATRQSENNYPPPALPEPFQPLLASLQQSKTKNEEYLRQMRTMIDAMPLRVGYVDNQSIYRDINQRLLDFLGLKREEVIGKSLEEILGPSVAAQYQEILPRVMNGETVRWEGWAEFPARGRHYLHRLVMPFAPEGGPPGTLTFTQDTTDSELAAQALAEKEALNRAVVTGARDAIVVMDEHGDTLQWNPAAEEIFGYSAAEAIGKKVGDLIVPQSMREMHRKGMERYLKTGEAAVLGRRLELQGLRKDGTLIPIELTITESQIEGRRLFTSHLRDITQQKAAEADLQRTRATLQSIFDNVPADLYLRDVDGTFVMMNKWGAEQRGLTPEDFIGRNVNEFRLPEEVQSGIDAERKLLASGRPVTGEFHIKYADKVATGLSTIFPVRNGAGEITQIGGVIMDVTELRQTREQLAAARDTLHQSEKLAALGQLLAGVAHELNNPLAIVLGRAAMLQEKLKGTAHEGPLQKMREAADRCARIVKTFLAMARQTGPRRRSVQINLLVDGALEMTSYGLRKVNVTLKQDLDPNLPEIAADEDQLIQILINLIMNAQHALAEHEGDRTIVVRTRHDAATRHAVLEVSDNGPGVSKDAAGRIFEPFFTTKAVGEGTGLGLAMCKGMVEAHGGTLTLHPTPGGGATFRVTLPANFVRADDVEGAAPVTHHKLKGRILVVDDEPELAAILADCLGTIGFETDIAADGAAALDKISRMTFDAIFCDVSMPVMDGIAMYRKLKKKNPVLAAKLVFVSGDVLHRDWEKMKASVERPIVEKPFDPEQIRKIAIELTGVEK